MNRKERRRQEKLAAKAGDVRRPSWAAPALQNLSAVLLRHAGQDPMAPIDPAALEIVAAQASTGSVDAAFAKLRREDILRQQVAIIQRALDANPYSVELLLTLAKLFRHLDRPQEALAAYRRVLEVDPSRVDVQHMIAALSGVPGAAPARAADAYVAEEFDGFAARYDEVLVGWLEYRGPEILHGAVSAVLGTHPPPQDIVDLGCGTGLAARVFRPMARRLDGVDLSPRMVEKARARALYDSLAVDEIGRFLAGKSQAYTLAIAADVLIYFGDLAPVFAAVAGALRPRGLFAFTVEAESGAGYRLTASGRYAHDDRYVRTTAESAGFEVVRATDETVRKEKLQPVHSRCYVLRLR